MGYPELQVKIAFDTNPLDLTPSFTGGDVSAYVRDRLTIRRGRTDDFGEFRAGTATVTLKNADRRFDPDNSSSPHASKMLPMRDISIAAVWDSVTYPLFYGYIVSWNVRYAGGNIAYADLSCVDGSEPLSRLQIGTPDTPVTLASATGDVRTEDVLDEVGWPASNRTIDSGADFILQASTLDGVPALEYLQLVARSEDGQFFISKEGKAVLQGRLYRSVLSSIDTWGDAADRSELPYRDLQTYYGADTIWNRAEITREGGAMQVDHDPASEVAYLTRTVSRTGLLLADDADALTIAEGIVDVYNDPRVRARSLKPQPHVRDTWAEVLGREISDRITVRRATLLGGSALDIDCFIEGINADLVRTNREWTWQFDWFLSSI